MPASPSRTPSGIAVDDQGYIYVTESYSCTYKIFAPDQTAPHIIKHTEQRPTGIVVASQNDRSQHKNKDQPKQKKVGAKNSPKPSREEKQKAKVAKEKAAAEKLAANRAHASTLFEKA